MVRAATEQPPMTLTLRQAAVHTGISRLRIAAAIDAGELPAIHQRWRNRISIRVVRSQLEQWVHDLTEVPA